jgi:lipopolysaccharide/colanic/teichoic acid biosynthesis glycosyltransferase
MVVIAILIKLDSPGPVIYRQRRVGIDRRHPSPIRHEESRRGLDLGGRPFTMYKFRTMQVDAERDSGPVWARAGDERATRVGRILRRHRLDEIPQFWNVLVGDMSVVGPRPERPNFVIHLQDEIETYRLRHRVKPGITGLAQVHRDGDRSTADVRAKVDYDLEYIRRRSLWLDLLIMVRTLPALFRRSDR